MPGAAGAGSSKHLLLTPWARVGYGVSIAFRFLGLLNLAMAYYGAVHTSVFRQTSRMLFHRTMQQRHVATASALFVAALLIFVRTRQLMKSAIARLERDLVIYEVDENYNSAYGSRASGLTVWTRGAARSTAAIPGTVDAKSKGQGKAPGPRSPAGALLHVRARLAARRRSSASSGRGATTAVAGSVNARGGKGKESGRVRSSGRGSKRSTSAATGSAPQQAGRKRASASKHSLRPGSSEKAKSRSRSTRGVSSKRDIAAYQSVSSVGSTSSGSTLNSSTSMDQGEHRRDDTRRPSTASRVPMYANDSRRPSTTSQVPTYADVHRRPSTTSHEPLRRDSTILHPARRGKRKRR